jgi:hypothetical protein
MLLRPSDFFEKKKIQEQLQNEVVEPEGELKVSRIKSPSELFNTTSTVEEVFEILEEVAEEVKIDPIEEIKNLVEEVRSQIPDIPEIKSYDSELNTIREELDKIYNLVDNYPEPKYYDEDVEQIHQKIDSIQIPQIKYYDEDIHNLNEKIDNIVIPEPKYYDEDVEQIHQKINSIKIPEVKYYDVEIYNLGEEIASLSSKISRLPKVKYYDEDIQNLHLKIDGIEIPEVRYYEEIIEELNQKIDNIKIPKIPEIKYYDQEIEKINEKIGSIQIPEVKYYDEDIKRLDGKINSVEIPEVKYYDEDIKNLHQKIDSIEIPKVTEVKYYDKDINDLKTSISIVKSSIKEPKFYDEDIKELRKIVKEIKEKQDILSLSETSLNESTEKISENILPTIDQNFATLDDLQNHYKVFINRIQQQLASLGGGGETRLEFLDDIDRTSAKTDGYYLKYDASTGKFVGSAVTVSGGSQTLDQTLSFGNTSSLGMSVGVLTATSFIGDGSQITGISTFSGNYNDLTNKPSIPTDTGDLTNSVGFVTSGIVVGYATESYVNNLVAISTFSRDYNDLTNKPTILSSFTNDVGFITSYTETSNLDNILGRGNSSSLGMSVGLVTATSFDGDLTGNSDTSTYALKSGISTVSEGLTGTPNIIVNLITATDASFSGNVSIAGTLTYEDVTSVDSIGIITARSGIFVGPVTSIGSTIDSFGNASFAGIVTASSFSGITTSMVVGLSTVSSTGSYNDLKDKPPIPTDTADLTNSVGFVTSSIVIGYATEGYVNNLVAISTFSGDYNDLTNTPTTLGSFANDVGFITSYTETSALNDILIRGNISGIGISVGLSTFVNNVHIGSATTFTENLVVTGNARVTGILTIGTSSITLDPETGIVSGINEISGNAETSSYAIISGVSTSVSGGTANVTSLILPDALISSSSIVLNNNSESSIDSFSSSLYRSVKYQIQITRGLKYQTTEIFIIHDGSLTYQTEYATISTGESLSSFSADILNGNVRLLTTPTSSETTTFKLIRNLIEV